MRTEAEKKAQERYRKKMQSITIRLNAEEKKKIDEVKGEKSYKEMLLSKIDYKEKLKRSF